MSLNALVEEKSSTNKSHKGTWKEISFITQHKTATIIWFQEKVAGFKNLPLGKKLCFTSSMSWQKPFASSDRRSLLLFSWKRLRKVSIRPSTRIPSVLSKRGLAPAKTWDEQINISQDTFDWAITMKVSYQEQDHSLNLINTKYSLGYEVHDF